MAIPLVIPPPDRVLPRVMKEAGNAERDSVAPGSVPRVAPADWSLWYLTDEEDVAQSVDHYRIAGELCGLLGELGRERGWQSVLISGDQFVAWVEEHPLVRVSPDVYITDVSPAAAPASWQTWLPGHRPPRFAVEIVSDDNWKKDYDEAPLKYASMGASELVIADPYSFMRHLHGRRGHGDRVPLQVHRRLGQDSLLTCVAKGSGPVHSAELDGWLLFCEDPHGLPRVRISRDPEGRDLVPLPVERADTMQAERDAARDRADAEAARADSETARADSEAARADSETARADSEAARANAAEALLRKYGLV